MKFTKFILIIVVSLSLPLVDIITFSFDCDFLGDMGPKFYGFPFMYRTEIPWVNSFEGDFYLIGYIGNVIFFFSLLISLRFLKNRYFPVNEKLNRLIRIPLLLASSLIALFATMIFFMHEWRFQWDEKYYSNYGGKELECKRHIEFFKIGE